jgi:hypothetical protein
MKIGNIVAYDCDPAKIAEVLDVLHFANGQLGLRVKPFDNSFPFYIYASEVWLLADNI